MYGGAVDSKEENTNTSHLYKKRSINSRLLETLMIYPGDFDTCMYSLRIFTKKLKSLRKTKKLSRKQLYILDLYLFV